MTFLGSLLTMKVLGFFFMFSAEGGGTGLGIYDLVETLTIPGWGVIITLLLQAIYLIAVGIERFLTYNKAKAQSRQYAPKVAQALKSSNIDEAINISDKHKDSHLAMVVSSGLKEFAAHQGNTDISGEEMEASKRALQRAIAIKTAELKRGLSGLATVGSTAPFVGLFGTVVGIIGAFQALKSNETAKPTPKPVPKKISGGVLNGKAISLPKPPYPAAAKAVRASGSVSVQVTINESGSVVSASAVSGHPLLQQAAVAAARQAKFAPTTLSGQAVSVSGIIIYNFNQQ